MTQIRRLSPIYLCLASFGFTLQGQISVEKPAASIRIVLLDPDNKKNEVASVEADADGYYEIRDLTKRAYSVLAYIDGKKQDSRKVNFLCRDGSTVSKDFSYSKSTSTLTLRFPAEDPDVADISEVPRDYPEEIFREFRKAESDYKIRNDAKAIQRYEAIAKLAPDFYAVHMRLGLLYQQQGCFEDSASEFLRASAISPRATQPLLDLASVQLQAATVPSSRDMMVANALETLERVLRIKPTSALAYCLSGAAHARVNAFEAAEMNFKRALELDEQLAAARLMLANLYIHHGDWEAGAENLTVYLQDFPYSSDWFVVRKMLNNVMAKKFDRPPSVPR